MDKSRLLDDIEAAKQSIRVAQEELQRVVKEIPIAPRADKTKVSEVVQAASSKLNVARTNLLHLRSKLFEVEDSESTGKISAARQALDDAGKHFDRVLSEMRVDVEAEKTWVTQVVHDALSDLNVARRTLDELEAITEDED